MSESVDAFDRAFAEAPVAVAFEVEVVAPLEDAWAALANVEQWPRWHRGIDFAVLRGASLVPGARLHWKGDGMRIRSVVTSVEPPPQGGAAGTDPAFSTPATPATTTATPATPAEARLEWTLSMLGGRGAQRWRLIPPLFPDPSPAGIPTLRIRLEEWWTGVTPRLVGGTLQRTLEVARSGWLSRLRTHLEGGRSYGPVPLHPPENTPRGPA